MSLMAFYILFLIFFSLWQVIQMSLQEIRCIKMCDDHHLAIYTCDADTSICPLTLQTSSEAELWDWVSCD